MPKLVSKKVKISIIIPMYNSEKTIAKCIKSILNSNYKKNYEIIIVDDGSTDNSINIVKKFKCKLIKLKNNRGVANARNIGARYSRGEILFFVDSDTVLGPNSVNIIADTFEKNPRTSIVNGIYSKKSYDNRIFTLYKSLNHHYHGVKDVKYKSTFLSVFCGAIRKRVFIDMGGFDNNIKSAGGEDAEFGSRISDLYKIIWAPKVEAIHYYPGFIKSMIKYIKRGDINTFQTLKGKSLKNHPYLSIDELIAYVTSILILSTLLLILFFNFFKLKIFILLLFLIFVISKIKFYLLLLKERKKYLFPIFIIINYIETLLISGGIILGIVRYLFRLMKK